MVKNMGMMMDGGGDADLAEHVITAVSDEGDVLLPNPANFPGYLHEVYCQTCTMEEEDIFKESVITLVLTHH